MWAMSGSGLGFGLSGWSSGLWGAEVGGGEWLGALELSSACDPSSLACRSFQRCVVHSVQQG